MNWIALGLVTLCCGAFWARSAVWHARLLRCHYWARAARAWTPLRQLGYWSARPRHQCHIPSTALALSLYSALCVSFVLFFCFSICVCVCFLGFLSFLSLSFRCLSLTLFSPLLLVHSSPFFLVLVFSHLSVLLSVFFMSCSSFPILSLRSSSSFPNFSCFSSYLIILPFTVISFNQASFIGL